MQPGAPSTDETIASLSAKLQALTDRVAELERTLEHDHEVLEQDHEMLERLESAKNTGPVGL